VQSTQWLKFLTGQIGGEARPSLLGEIDVRATVRYLTGQLVDPVLGAAIAAQEAWHRANLNEFRQEINSAVVAFGIRGLSQPLQLSVAQGIASSYLLYEAKSESEASGEELPLSTGMLVVSEIHQRQRTVMEYLLSPVQKVAQEAARER
jgi:hypothetical protein